MPQSTTPHNLRQRDRLHLHHHHHAAAGTKPRPTHSHLLTSGAKQILNFSGMRHPQQTFTERLREAEQLATASPGKGDRMHRPMAGRRHTS